MVTSTFFGDLGAALDNDHIKHIGLCGMQSTVMKIAKRMNVIPGNGFRVPSENVQEHIFKIKAFDSLEHGFSSLLK